MTEQKITLQELIAKNYTGDAEGYEQFLLDRAERKIL